MDRGVRIKRKKERQRDRKRRRDPDYLWKLAKEIHDMVQKWPEEKREECEAALFHESDDSRCKPCKCGYVDCNHRGY